jgi:hypothetical protein
MRNARRILTLLVSAVAISAIGGPAIASAEGPYWYVDGEKLESPIELQAAGELRFVGGFGMGPCEVELEGVLENESGHAAGQIMGGSMNGPCATGLTGCTLEAALYNFNWDIYADATGVSIENTRFNNPWSEYCRSQHGLSASWTWGGTLKTETFNNFESCLEYSEAGELSLIPSGGKLKTTGVLCLSSPEGSEIVLADTTDKPKVSSESATDVGTETAKLKAVIDPQGVPTSYQFEYGKTASYGQKSPLSPQAIGSSPSESVERSLSSLSSNTTYHYRVVATNAVGTTYGPDKTFHTEEPRLWLVNGEPLDASENIEGGGELTFMLSSGVKLGPCEPLPFGTVSNSSGQASGALTTGTHFSGPCSTSLPTCTVSLSAENLPWDMSFLEGGLVLSSPTVRVQFAKACKDTYGLPTELHLAGTLGPGLLEEAGCFEYSETGGMYAVENKGAVTVSGNLCFYGEGGEVPVSVE